MKKLLIALIALTSFTFTSCKKENIQPIKPITQSINQDSINQDSINHVNDSLKLKNYNDSIAAYNKYINDSIAKHNYDSVYNRVYKQAIMVESYMIANQLYPPANPYNRFTFKVYTKASNFKKCIIQSGDYQSNSLISAYTGDSIILICEALMKEPQKDPSKVSYKQSTLVMKYQTFDGFGQGSTTNIFTKGREISYRSNIILETDYKVITYIIPKNTQL
jgi:hypothetical protein